MNTGSKFGLVLAVLACSSQLSVAVLADTWQGNVSHNHHYSKYHGQTYLQRHPKVKAAAVGAGVGTAAGAVTGLVSGRGVVRGAAIGAGTGAGVGLIRSSAVMKRHPYAKNLATGAAVGAGLGLAANKGHGTARKTTEAAAVGGALGLGAEFLKKHM